MAKNRKRSIDINKLSVEQADELSEQIGVKVRDICDKSAKEINEILAIYGMKAKVAIAFEPLQQESSGKQS